MKVKFTLLVIVAIAILAKFTYDQFVPPFSKGDPAPLFSLQNVSGNMVNLSDLKGRPVLVHFWATWCSQCAQEIPSLDNFAKLFPDILVLAINEDEGGIEAVSAFFAGMKPEFTILLDPDGTVADKYKSYKVPESYLIDEDGKIVDRFIGQVEWDNPKVVVLIKKMLSSSTQKIQ